MWMTFYIFIKILYIFIFATLYSVTLNNIRFNFFIRTFLYLLVCTERLKLYYISNTFNIFTIFYIFIQIFYLFLCTLSDWTNYILIYCIFNIYYIHFNIFYFYKNISVFVTSYSETKIIVLIFIIFLK